MYTAPSSLKARSCSRTGTRTKQLPPCPPGAFRRKVSPPPPLESPKGEQSASWDHGAEALKKPPSVWGGPRSSDGRRQASGSSM